MSVDCYALTAKVKGGSSVCVLECGGVQLTEGDILYVKAPLAGAIYVKYKRYFSAPVATKLDKERLKNNYYEYKSVPKRVVDEQKKLGFPSSDRSMANEKAKKKTKVKAKAKDKEKDDA